MKYKITFAQGHGSVRHNNRDFVAGNVDEQRIQNDVVLCRESLEDAYRDVFEDAINEYNLHQKQRCRRLSVDKYIDRIRRGQDGETNPKISYETIVQIGNRDNAGFDAAPDVAQKMADILACYYKDFVARNAGHIHVYNAVIHMDEATPHMHIDWIPFADGYKRGMQRRNSLEKAMGQLGYKMNIADKTRKRNNRSNWQDAERDRIKSICRTMGIEADYERHDQPEIHLSPDEFRKLGRMVDSRYQDEAQKALDRAAKAKDEYLDAFGQGKGLKSILGRFRNNSTYLDRVVGAAAQSQAFADAHLQAQKAALQQQQKQLGLERQLLEDDTSRAQDIIDTAAAELADQEQRKKALELAEHELAEQRRQLEILRQQIRQEQEKADKAREEAENAKAKSQAAAASLEAYRDKYPNIATQKGYADYLNGKIARQDRDIADLKGKLAESDKSIKSVLSVLNEREISLIQDTGLSLDEVLQRHVNAAFEKGKKEGRDIGYDAGKADADAAVKEMQDKQDKLQADIVKSQQTADNYLAAWQDLVRDLRDHHHLKVVQGRDGRYEAKKIGIQRQHSQDKGMSR